MYLCAICSVCPCLCLCWMDLCVSGKLGLKRAIMLQLKPLLRDSAGWSLTMPPSTGRQMALARKKPSFVFGIKSDAGQISTSVNERVSESSQEHLGEWRGEAARLLKHNYSHNPALWRLHWTRLFMRQLRKLKMSWFKLVKTMGHEAGQGDFNDQNQWSSSMIKCKLNSISFCRISLLTVCGLQVIRKVIRENERRLWGILHFQSGACLIILSIFYMNSHTCDKKKSFYCMCSFLKKKGFEDLHNGTKVPHLHT